MSKPPGSLLVHYLAGRHQSSCQGLAHQIFPRSLLAEAAFVNSHRPIRHGNHKLLLVSNFILLLFLLLTPLFAISFRISLLFLSFPSGCLSSRVPFKTSSITGNQVNCYKRQQVLFRITVI